jgi:ABC-type glycerol-3-phosphate transport system permease component
MFPGKIFAFENIKQPLLSRRKFARRLFNHFLVGLCLILLSLIIGVFGYHFIENFGWIDSLLNASMILGGMGPVNELHTDAGKIFASMYALFSGIIFLVTAGVLLAPLMHRLLHILHLDDSPAE